MPSDVEKRIFDYAFSTVNDDALAMQGSSNEPSRTAPYGVRWAPQPERRPVPV
jgi:hypothetical protein